MSETLALSRIPLDQYAQLLGASEIEELRALAKPLRGRSIEMINSTAVGGGVAEILNRLVPIEREQALHAADEAPKVPPREDQISHPEDRQDCANDYVAQPDQHGAELEGEMAFGHFAGMRPSHPS